MRKIIKRVGGSLGIIFNKEDCEAYDLKVDDVIEFIPIKINEEVSHGD